MFTACQNNQGLAMAQNIKDSQAIMSILALSQIQEEALVSGSEIRDSSLSGWKET